MSSSKKTVFATRRNLPLLLLQAREQVMAQFRPILNEAGLTEQQWRVMRELVVHGPREPREIVELCRISSPSLAGVLSRMDRMGLVERERFDDDQRRVRVSATARSRALAARLEPRITAVYDDIEARVGRDFTQALYGSLDELIGSLSADQTKHA